MFVKFCVDVFGSCQVRKEKRYKTSKIGQRYIDNWLSQSDNNFCQLYDFENKEWFTAYRVSLK